MPIYLEYEGIKGNITSDGYKDYFEVQSLQFGVRRDVSTTQDSLPNRQLSKPAIDEIYFTKRSDNATAALFSESLSDDTKGKRMVAKFVSDGTGNTHQFMEITLEGCIICSYDLSASSEGTPVECFSVNFSKISLKYYGHDKPKQIDKPQVVDYDLENQTFV